MIYLAALLLNIIITLSLGIFVYKQNTQKQENLFYLLTMIFVSLWMGALFFADFSREPGFVLWGARMANAFTSFIPWGIFLLARTFLEKAKIPRKSLYYSVILPIFFFLAGFTPLIVDRLKNEATQFYYGPLYPVFALYFGYFILYSIYIFSQKAKKYPDKRSTVYLVLSSFAFSCCYGFITSLLLPLWGLGQYYYWAVLSPLIFSAAMAYGIIRYQLLNVRLMIKKSLLSAFIFFAFSLLYLGLISLIESVKLVKEVPQGVTVIIFFILIMFFNTLRSKLENIFDQTFHKERILLEAALKDLGPKLLAILDINKLVKEVKDNIVRTLKAEKVSFYIKQDGAMQEYDLKDTLSNNINIQKGIFYAQEKNTEVDVYLPLREGDIVIGVLGIKFSRNPFGYTEEIYDLLTIFSQQISLALANALHFEREKVQKEQLFQSEKTALIGQLTAGIVHEIRNPVTSLNMTIENMKACLQEAGYDPKVIDRLANSGQNSAKELKGFLTNLLDFSRKEEFVKKHVGIQSVIEDALYIIRKAAKDKKVDVKVDIPKDVVVNCDARKIKQVILNLCMNAIDAMPDGGVLTIGAVQADSNVKITVKDTGAGIPADKLNHIFTPFYTSKKNGTGLGLSIVKEITDLHHGTVEVQSTLGQGTQFSIQLPLN